MIKLNIKNVYGVERIYPACDVSAKLAQLTGRKTFDVNDLNIIKSLGYDLEYVASVPNFAGV